MLIFVAMQNDASRRNWERLFMFTHFYPEKQIISAETFSEENLSVLYARK